ncbi:uncharacterized protein LOC121878615 [Homarus americanus]|uniref:uncharacterized protein LOC121878615 n=1 Tax=Homarus americanus TaxID=6706 RepID=UPI001C470989|nr:uncharacterized protein LOC121878615 [Homarus americanus]
MWRGDSDTREPYLSLSQVCLFCRRESNGKKFDCGTQTYHFSQPVTDSPEPTDSQAQSKETALASLNLKTVIQKRGSQSLVCCVPDCATRLDERECTASFYTIPSDEAQRLLWLEALDINLQEPEKTLHVCGQHFIIPKRLPTAKARTRKKKTCDMTRMC